MARRHAIIEASQTRLELAVVEGRRVVSTCIERFDVGTGPFDDVDARRDMLTGWVDTQGLRGCPAIILADTASGVAMVHTCPAMIRRHTRADSALLALDESVSFPPTDSVRSVAPLFVDAPVDRDAGETTTRGAHMLAVADADHAVADGAALVEQCGLRFQGTISTDAVLLAQTVGELLPASSGTDVVLHVGEHGSVIACATDGRLRFARPVAIGLEQLVDALTRVPADGTSSQGLTHEEARNGLFHAGIPERGEMFNASHNVGAELVLPLLQPVLQRCIVDVKQSLRFGLSPTERSGARLRLCGYGAAVPRLGAIIAESCGMTHRESQQVAYSNGTRPASTDCGVLRAFLTCRSLLDSMMLSPRELVSRRFSRRLERAIWAGAAAALALVGTEATLVRDALHTERDALAGITTRSDADLSAGLASAVSPLVDAVHGARRRIDMAITPAPPWAAALELIAKYSGDQIHLDRIEMVASPDGPQVRLEGHASFDQAEGPAVPIRSFIDRLENTPLVAGVALGSTERVLFGERTLQRFQLTASLEPLPPSYHVRRASAVLGRAEVPHE